MENNKNDLDELIELCPVLTSTLYLTIRKERKVNEINNNTNISYCIFHSITKGNFNPYTECICKYFLNFDINDNNLYPRIKESKRLENILRIIEKELINAHISHSRNLQNSLIEETKLEIVMLGDIFNPILNGEYDELLEKLYKKALIQISLNEK